MLDQGKQTIVVRLLRGTLLLLMRILFRIEHYGWERIPRDGPLLFVANHVTYFDPPWISVRVYRTLRIMAWDKLFRFPLAGQILRWFGAFPISLENPESGAYKAALRILRKGEALMLFPQGGRSSDTSPLPFKEGAARLALRTGATIVPVVVHGGENVWSNQMLLPCPAKVRIYYLPPITKEQFPENTEELMQQVREAIMNHRDLAQPRDHGNPLVSCF
jgi:1-acyl-sn-glycerol-3-phosphate acyltransferase